MKNMRPASRTWKPAAIRWIMCSPRRAKQIPGFTVLASGETNQLHQFLDKILLKLTYENGSSAVITGMCSCPPRVAACSAT